MYESESGGGQNKMLDNIGDENTASLSSYRRFQVWGCEKEDTHSEWCFSILSEPEIMLKSEIAETVAYTFAQIKIFDKYAVRETLTQKHKTT